MRVSMHGNGVGCDSDPGNLILISGILDPDCPIVFATEGSTCAILSADWYRMAAH